MANQRRDWKADVDAIRVVLRGEWNPIGCNVPDDEYDSYIPTMYRLMQAQVSVPKLASHLTSLETGSMGLSVREGMHQRNKRVAEKLLDLMS